MAAQLATIAGDSIMSINDTAFVREAFAAFEIEEVLTTWTIAKSATAGTKVTELIIRNRR
jgi:DNA adenine methylase